MGALGRVLSKAGQFGLQEAESHQVSSGKRGYTGMTNNHKPRCQELIAPPPPPSPSLACHCLRPSSAFLTTTYPGFCFLLTLIISLICSTTIPPNVTVKVLPTEEFDGSGTDQPSKLGYTSHGSVYEDREVFRRRRYMS